MTDSESESKLRINAVSRTVTFLEKERNYFNVSALGQGTYGDVIRMRDPKKYGEIAVKIVTSDKIADMELDMWPQLDHPNIIHLLESLRGPLETAVFIMPVQEKSLHDMILDEFFYQQTDCLKYVKSWLSQILCGLGYLHSNNLCHLDIKTNNILLSAESTAVICDFSFLHFTTEPIKKWEIGLPYIYRPPEASNSLDNITVDGISFDLWSYGIMVVEIFTYFVLSQTVSHETCWYREVYPTLFDALQEHAFREALENTYPGAEINTDEVRLSLNFIHLFLNSDHKKRWTSSRAMKHRFLEGGTDLGPMPDPIWIRKIDIYESDSDAFEEDIHRIYEDEQLSPGTDEECQIGSATGGERCNEIWEEIYDEIWEDVNDKKCEEHITELNNKIIGLSSAMKWENLPISQVFDNSTDAEPKVKHTIEWVNDILPEHSLAVETGVGDRLAVTEEMSIDFHYEIPFGCTLQNDKKNFEKKDSQNNWKGLKWFRKRFASLGKLFKCCYPTKL